MLRTVSCWLAGGEVFGHGPVVLSWRTLAHFLQVLLPLRLCGRRVFFSTHRLLPTADSTLLEEAARFYQLQLHHSREALDYLHPVLKPFPFPPAAANSKHDHLLVTDALRLAQTVHTSLTELRGQRLAALGNAFPGNHQYEDAARLEPAASMCQENRLHALAAALTNAPVVRRIEVQQRKGFSRAVHIQAAPCTIWSATAEACAARYESSSIPYRCAGTSAVMPANAAPSPMHGSTAAQGAVGNCKNFRMRWASAKGNG